MERVNRWVYWTPRVLAILFIVFLFIFSLDVFEEASGIGVMLLGLLMHNIPVIVLLVILIISWKHEWLAAGVFILAGFAYVFLVAGGAAEWGRVFGWSMVIAVPAWIVGILFWMNWRARQRKV